MITYVEGGFFSLPAQTLVNTVNTAGVMGKGLAKEFKTIWPEMFAAYAERCAAGEVVPGALHLWRSPHKWVLNFPTKRHWRHPSRLADVEAGLRTFAAAWADYGLTSVAFPQLGCGNGGLDWEKQVRPLMERWLLPLPIDVFVHVADGGPLLPAGPDGKALVAWLRAEPSPPAFDEFVDGLRAAVRDGVPGWLLNPDGDLPACAVADGEPRPIDRADWRRVWRSLAAGGLLDAGVAATLGVPAAAAFDLLERTPGVAAIKAAAGDPDAPGSNEVSRMLAEPNARAFRYDPITADEPAPARPGRDGDAPWTGNRMQQPLPMPLTG